MIPIKRPPLDAATQTKLDAKTRMLGSAPGSSQARDAWSGAGTVKKTLKQTLARAAYRSWFCMYCQESRGTDVDHFHPISCAPHLVFTWMNHLLACAYCNQTAKRDLFPVDGRSQPLLLDPTVDDAGDHLMVSLTGSLIPLTVRGEVTVKVLHLNSRPAITDARSQSFARIVRAFDAGRVGKRPLTEQGLRGLGYCAMESLHLLAHAIRRGDCDRLPYLTQLADYAPQQLPQLRRLFPDCSF